MPRCAPCSSRGLGLVAAGLLLAGCEPAASPEDAAARLRALAPLDLVLIVVDTLRPDRLGPYGETRGTTPSLDAWAGRGVVFERALAQSSWTKVSMASLLTSLWPHSHGVREPDDGLAETADTVAEVLRRAGYRTYAVQSNGWLEQTFGFHQGFDRYAFPRGGQAPGFQPMIWPHADRVFLEARRLLDAHDAAAPFFLYLHFMDVHEYAAPADHRRFGTDEEGAYLAAISWVDEVIGRLGDELGRRGRLDRCVLVLASDHGETFGETGVRGHARNVRTPVLRVPLLMRLPFPIAPRRIATQVRNVDLAPTLLDLAGVPIPAHYEGESLMPLLAEDGPDRPGFAALTARLYQDAVLQDGVQDGAWSLVRNAEAPRSEALFDTSIDPDENVDLLEIEPIQAERMREALDAHLARSTQDGVVRRQIRIDPALAEKLRALGYVPLTGARKEGDSPSRPPRSEP